MTRVLLMLAAVSAVVASVAGTQNAFPSRIELPDGFQPEGIAIAGEQFYVGSIPTGKVYRGSLRTGQGAELVTAPAGPAAIGMKVDRGRLFVAGGGTGGAWVYDATTGETIASYSFAEAPTFINDVAVTKEAAWFTDSQKAALYRVPLGPNGSPATTFQTLSLEGDFVQQSGFNTNGIDATPNGKMLVIVQSNTGKLFTVTPVGAIADADEIELADYESVPMGDGILLDGKTLYVVQNRANMVAEIQLAPDLGSGVVLTRITNTDLEPPALFDVPTTIAEHGSRLYAVNARFTTAPTPGTPYWVAQFGK
jgi:sugar lactone lactonase YvrE